ncbi:hypothetical protein CR513_19444, partial [Mucuna pruriens]
MGTQNCILDSIRDVSLSDHLYQAMQPSLRPGRQSKKAPATRTGGASLGSIRELPNLQVKGQEFKVGQKVLLVNSHLKLIVVELKDENIDNTFQVNGHQIELFYEGLTPIVGEMESISLMEPGSLDGTP